MLPNPIDFAAGLVVLLGFFVAFSLLCWVSWGILRTARAVYDYRQAKKLLRD